MIDSNIQSLYKRLPYLLDYTVKEDSLLEIVPSKKGDPTAIYNKLYLHSKYDPVKEAVKIAKELEKSNLIIIGGFGLGYHVEEIVKQQPDSTIVVFEPNMDLFMEAMKLKDFSFLINSKNVYFLISQNIQTIKDFLVPRLIKKAIYIPLNNRVKNNEELFFGISDILRLYHERIRINRNTLLKFGKLWVKNQSKNLPLMGYKSDITHIFGKFHDIPGIIISAGPSMELIIPHLKKIQDRFVILAVDTALKSLLEEGIEPDFVMSIDSQYWNARHLEGVKTDKTILIADSSIQPSALRFFEDRVYFTKSTFPLGQYFEKVRSPFPKIASGGSVSTNIWDFAQKLGLSEIFFIGQDLGYPGNITHYKNSYFEKNMLTSSNRIKTLETQSFFYIYNGYPTTVLSNSGEEILSDKRMGIYIDWFKEKIALNPIKNSFNLSPNGCKIEGLKYRPIKSLLDYPKNRVQITNIISVIKKRDNYYYLPQILEAAIHFKENLELVVKLGQKAFNLCILIEKNFHNRLDINNQLKELTILDNKIVSYNHSQTLSFIIEPFISQITESEQGTALEALQLSGRLYNKIVTTGHLHIKYLNQSIYEISKTANNTTFM